MPTSSEVVDINESTSLITQGVDNELYRDLTPDQKLELAKFQMMTPAERATEQKYQHEERMTKIKMKFFFFNLFIFLNFHFFPLLL